jgi:hypothetical protein
MDYTDLEERKCYSLPAEFEVEAVIPEGCMLDKEREVFVDKPEVGAVPVDYTVDKVEGGHWGKAAELRLDSSQDTLV